MTLLEKTKETIKNINQQTNRGVLIVIGSQNIKHGTGRSSISKKLAQQLNAIHYSTGDKFRELAKNAGMTISEYAQHTQKHPEIDQHFDQQVQKEVYKLIKQQKNVIADSNLLAHFLTPDVSIAIDTNDTTRAKRVYNKHRQGDKKYQNTQDALEDLDNRMHADQKRYKALYNIDSEELSKTYDCHVRNDGTLEETLKQAITCVYKKLSHDKKEGEKICKYSK
ncbi:AAA family ATPase [archaeon]|nr:AAA family ATPase [archaeon]